MNSCAIGDEIELMVDAVAHGGDGIGRIEGLACFVTGALPGDRLRARIFRRSRKAAWGRLLQVIEASPFRQEAADCTGPACAAACVWRHFAYPAQAEWKQRIVRDTLARIGRVDCAPRFLEAPEWRLGYRTRATFHGNGSRLGYYVQGTHDLIPIEHCPLHHARLNAALRALTASGVAGDVTVTVNPEGEHTLVWLRRENERVRQLFPLTDRIGARVPAWFLFDGAPIVNGAFSQSSLLLNRILRRETAEALDGARAILDLYCGNGNLSLPFIDTSRVVGVDRAGAAVNRANHLAPGCYRQGDEALMCRLLAEGHWDAVLLDPPRTGADALINALIAARSDRLVYVSCNPATLARDLGRLTPAGWRLLDVAVIDLFPHTPHVETVCRLSR